MKYANQFRHTASELKSDLAGAIETQLKRLDISHVENEDEPLEFFSYSTTADLGICEIKSNGNLKFTIRGMDGTIRGYIEDDLIGIDDAISLLEELEQM